MDSKIGVKGFIVAVLNEGKKNERIFETHNILSNAGDIFYAQKAAGEAPTNAFANLVLGSTGVPTPTKGSTYSTITPIANTNKAPSAGFPKTNDLSADNTGKGVNVITRKYEYTGTDFNAASITEGVITIPAPVAGSPLLCHFSFGGAFSKAASDTLTVYVNHVMTGA